jgi:hypothetical protein
MTDRVANDIALGLLALLSAAVFLGIGEEAVAVTLSVLGVLCLAGCLQDPSAE